MGVVETVVTILEVCVVVETGVVSTAVVGRRVVGGRHAICVHANCSLAVHVHVLHPSLLLNWARYAYIFPLYLHVGAFVVSSGARVEGAQYIFVQISTCFSVHIHLLHPSTDIKESPTV